MQCGGAGPDRTWLLGLTLSTYGVCTRNVTNIGAAAQSSRQTRRVRDTTGRQHTQRTYKRGPGSLHDSRAVRAHAYTATYTHRRVRSVQASRLARSRVETFHHPKFHPPYSLLIEYVSKSQQAPAEKALVSLAELVGVARDNDEPPVK